MCVEVRYVVVINGLSLQQIYVYSFSAKPFFFYRAFVFFVAVMHCAEMQNALNEIESLKKERNELNDKVEAYEKSLEVMCTIKTTDLEEEEERE